jgi:N utilization substance protein A
MVVNELRGEKIDIVPFSEDLADFVAKALSPAKVKEVIISADGTQAEVIVPDHQLSLAIGKEGQNARLAARLTGVRIDIRGESQPSHGAVEDEADYAEGEWVENAAGAMEFRMSDGSIMTMDEWNVANAAPGAETAPVAADGENGETPVTEASAATDTTDTTSDAADASPPAANGADDASS